MKNLFKFLITASLSSLLIACGGNTTPPADATPASETVVDNTPLGQAGVVDDESNKDILKVAIGSADHTTLVAAVQAAHIEHVLSNAGPLTVFAPTNEAFAALPEGTVENLLKPENLEMLATILTRHASPGSFDIEKLKKEAAKGRKVYTATGDYLEIRVEGEDVFVHGAKVIASVPTSNGIINVVDKVILL